MTVGLTRVTTRGQVTEPLKHMVSVLVRLLENVESNASKSPLPQLTVTLAQDLPGAVEVVWLR